MTDYTPIMKQYIEIKNKHKDAILLFRLGDFYEIFFEDALICSDILMLTLTHKGKYKNKIIPMCGFPYYTSNNYIEKLMKAGKHVAVCEQINNIKKNGLIERKVINIWTPGTFVSDNYLDQKKNNYIICIHNINKFFGISALDISTGHFFLNQFNKLSYLYDEIDRINPIEILMSNESSIYLKKINKNIHIQIFADKIFDYDNSLKYLSNFIKNKNYSSKKLLKSKPSIIAAGFLIHYIEKNHNNKFKSINCLEFYNSKNLIYIDKNTRKNLEIFKSLTGNENDSLFNSINMTSTIIGERLLKRLLSIPLKSSNNKLKQRSNAVSKLKKNKDKTDEITINLKNISDVEKMIYNIDKNQIKPPEIKKLQKSLESFKKIKKILYFLNKNKLLKKIHDNICNFDYLIDLINKSILDLPSNNIKDGNIIKNSFDKKIDYFRNKIKNIDQEINNYIINEQTKTNIIKLKINMNKNGYFIELPKKIQPPNYYKKIKDMNNVSRYTTFDLKNIEINSTIYNKELLNREIKIYNIICYKIKKELKKIQIATKYIALLDVLKSFTEISYNYNWCAAKLVNYPIIKIKNGRHPILEIKNTNYFISNNTKIDENNKIFIITGANMSGKSTYMRQIAIITLLSHIGSHVPAKKITIGGIDKIFTRIGANDDITNSLSTFMLEIKELKLILKNSTQNSLILIDEIGRGTNYLEGKSLALAILSDFIFNKKSFLLFSTHFYELSYISKLYKNVKSIFFKVKYEQKKLIFLYKYKNGICNKGFALQVAELANIPKNIIFMAKYYLKNFNKNDKNILKINNQITNLKLLNINLKKNLILINKILKNIID